MTDRSLHDLHYGHFGFPSYNVENHSWDFPRQPGQRKELRPLDEPKISIEASGAEQVERNTNNADIFRKKQFSGLYPELLLEKDVLARDLQVSQAIDIVASKYDPLRGDLLAFGRARDVHRKGSRAALAFAAVPGGKAGEALRLIRAVPTRHGWRNDKNFWVRTPELEHGENGWWCGNGAPIMQIIAAAPTAEDRGTYLAARTARSVHLFRPLFHRTPVSASKAPNSRSSFPPSRLEASPLVTFLLEPNDPAISDFTFNPWYQRQFATLNQEGSWSIWDLEGRKGRRHRYKTVVAYSGHLESADDTFEQDEDLGGRYDCWGRITWVKDVSTVAVCNRRNVVVSDFRGHSARLSAASLRLGRSTWILDLRLDPLDPKRLLVLTSSHVLVIQVPSLENKDPQKAIDPVVPLSWRHFRNVEDTTLQITPVVQEQDCILLLRSQQNSLVTSLSYKRQEDAESALVACSDPIELNLGPRDTPGARPSSVVGVHAQPLEYSEVSGRETAGIGQQYRDHGVRFFGLWFLSIELEIYQQFASVWDSEYDLSEPPWRNAPQVEQFSWYGKGSAQLSSRIVTEDFFVPDEYASEEEDVTPPWLNGKRYRRHRVQALPRDLPTDGVDHRTVNNTRVCQNLNESIKAEAEDITAAATSLREVLGTEPDADTHHNDTLMQFAGFHIGVDDVDEGSLAFAELLQSFSLDNVAENALCINVLKNAQTQLGEEVGSPLPSISATYDKIIQTWLSGLPQDTPGRVRLTNERLARQVATQLCLSATTIRIKQPAPQSDEAEAADSQRLDYESPLKVQSQGAGFEPDPFPSSLPGSQLGSSQSHFHGTLPTPEATPSLVSGTTFSSGVSSINDGAVSRLRQYTTFSKQRPSLNRQMTRLLSHWVPGTNPELYDYYATKRANERAAAMNDEGLTQKERERLHRKAMRHLKRQRRETAAHLAQTASQTPLMIHHQPQSSPGPANIPRPNLSQFVSSQMTPSQFPSTQVERGTHGGRPKKKKRRIEGF
ncbi:RNA polymerase I-specific transcription initiation factor RRN6-like protein [Phyllosticta citrichinensis]|uniref:RNA polymerase I-specific transcription initiation factor RRN6-like protein n=1 Tax=Phyllosticta citrichinensis TaxID=1130410 RepID=A0ABR1XP96_9PEZI